MIDWKCMGWDEMKTDIVANKGTFGNGTCDFAVAGFAAVPVSYTYRLLLLKARIRSLIRIIIRLFRLQNLDREGLEFTWPSTRVGKRLMVMVSMEKVT